MDFEFGGGVGALFDDALLVGELEVGFVLFGRGNPAVANEETGEVPFVGGLAAFLVALKDSLGDVGDVLAGVGFSSNKYLNKTLELYFLAQNRSSTYIVVFILGEQLEPLLQESNKLVSHNVEFAYISVGVDIAEPRADRVIDEEDIGELVPCSLVVHQRVLIF